MFGLDINKVVIRFPYVGGGFGAKELMTEHLIIMFLARQTGRPVAFFPSAEESFRTVCRHAAVFNVKTGVALCMPAFEPVDTYTVKVEGNDILVEVDL